MMLNRLQAASIMTLMALITVPSLALPWGPDLCYQADLLHGKECYGKVKLMVSGDESLLEVEIEGLMEAGEYEVTLFKNYYSDIVAGTMDVGEDGKGEATFTIPFMDPDFTVHVQKGDTLLISGEWVECERPFKHEDVKVSPRTLNLKSMGRWVTVKITIQTDPEPTDFRLNVNGGTLEPATVKVAPGHVILKFSREALQELCTEGETEVTVSLKIGDESLELTDTIRVINEGNNGATQAHQGRGAGSNNGKANGNGNGNGKGKKK